MSTRFARPELFPQLERWPEVGVTVERMSTSLWGALALVLLSEPDAAGPAQRTSPRLAPDGQRLAWLAPDARGVPQLWVKRLGTGDEAMVSRETRRRIGAFEWTRDGSGLLFTQDDEGDERFHVFLLELASKNVRDLTPWQTVRARLLASSAKQPERLLLEANVRDRHLMDVWRIDLRTGAAELDTLNPGDVSSWLADASLTVRAAVASTPQGGTEVRFRENARVPFRALITTGLEERVAALGFTDDGKALYVTTSIDADTDRLVEKSLKTGAERELAASPRSDVGAVLRHPVKDVIRAVAFDADGRRAWTAMDTGVKGDLEAMAKALPGAELLVESMDAADAKWIIAETRAGSPPRFWLWHRKARRLEPLFSTAPEPQGLAASPPRPVSVLSRDGLALPGSLTVPVGSSGPAPLVLRVRLGGSRADWGADGLTPLLASRGYAVLEVSVRGSTGFGKRLYNAGHRASGGAVQLDLVDAVAWAVKEGLADAKRVAIVGEGPGASAALEALALAPDVFACGVDRAGATGALLQGSAPQRPVDRLKAPLLIVHGANDARVSATESDELVAALAPRQARVTSVRYPDEGRQLERAENRLDYAARVERFLGECLRGRAEPRPAEGRVPGSSAEVRELGLR
jgi:dipeptidyl aminopeptidase/acylaminoacyl peptidase